MNFKSISFYLSLFCFPISFLSFINILYASYFDYFLSIDTYFTTLLISLILGFALFYYGKNSRKNISFVEQLILIISISFCLNILLFYVNDFSDEMSKRIFINPFLNSMIWVLIFINQRHKWLKNI